MLSMPQQRVMATDSETSFRTFVGKICGFWMARHRRVSFVKRIGNGVRPTCRVQVVLSKIMSCHLYNVIMYGIFHSDVRHCVSCQPMLFTGCESDIKIAAAAATTT